MRRSNAALFWPVLVTVTSLDYVTKTFAASRLTPKNMPHEVWGDWLRFTLVYNPGAAFGLNLGASSRWIFMTLTVLALGILARLYWATKAGDTARTLSLALVCGGAVGNLLDRIFSAQGVVDFIDVGLRDSRWPTFNIADMAVSMGAFLLAWVLWGEDAETVPVAAAAPATVPSESGELS